MTTMDYDLTVIGTGTARTSAASYCNLSLTLESDRRPIFHYEDLILQELSFDS